MTCFRTAFLLLALCLTTVATSAGDYTAGAIRVSNVWTREVPGGAKVAAGYMTITNTGKEPDTLIGGSIPIAAKFEVHEMKVEGGIAKMRRLSPGLTIKPGETVVLKPGSSHVMFPGLKQGPKRGVPVKGALIFEKAGRIEVEYKVAPIGARHPGDGKKPGPEHDHKPKSGDHSHH